MEIITFFSKFYKILLILIINYLCNNIARGENITTVTSLPNQTELWIMDNYEYCKEALFVPFTNITTNYQFYNFDFVESWFLQNHYWDEFFEERFKRQFQDNQRHPLRVIIVPHYYNNNGWLKPYLEQYKSHSKVILNSVISSMIKFTEMTFVWSEVGFLQLWWDQANLTQRKNLKGLIDSGRFEITTGGWVTPNEASVHIYAMVDQLIEGHHWLKANLNIKPTVSLSSESFGYSSTVPYLLAALDFEGIVIQRTHYAWKQWFSKYQNGDFIWQPSWQIPPGIKRNILAHSMPFNLYSSQHSCGPDANICSKFDFSSAKRNSIDASNVAEKSNILMNEYAKVASLYDHNVALILVGIGIRYRYEYEIEQQYVNFKKLIDYVNNHKDCFSTKISFGTPKDYFHEIAKRNKEFPTLDGDFPMYSDINKIRKRAFLSNKSYFKILSNELEYNLRSSEILFTLAYNSVRQNNRNNAVEVLTKSYTKIKLSRRNLAILQHHNAITSVTAQRIIEDFSNRCSESLQDLDELQETAIPMILQNINMITLQPEQFKKLPIKRLIELEKDSKKFIVLFNSLAQKRLEIISFRSNMYNILILNDEGLSVVYQVNPIWNDSELYEISFLVDLLPLSIKIYQLTPINNMENATKMTTIYCRNCYANTKIFKIRNLRNGDIHLKNKKLDLLFNGTTGFLKLVKRKTIVDATITLIEFDAYKIADLKGRLQKSNFNFTQQHKKEVIISFGSLFSEIIVKYGPFFTHTIRIFHTNTYLDYGIYTENDIDVNKITNKTDMDLFMRIRTNIFNLFQISESYHTDQNGFQTQPRVFAPTVDTLDNFYPITSTIFIQDKRVRLTILTIHSQIAASMGLGQVEIMLNRRMSYLNSTKIKNNIKNLLQQHKVWFFIEDIIEFMYYDYQVPSLFANLLANSLRYPPNIYIINDGNIEFPIKNKNNLNFIRADFPCNIHLMNVRTLTDKQMPAFPSRSALVLLHRQGYDCGIGLGFEFCNNLNLIASDLYFNGLKIESIKSTSLTGLNEIESIDSFENISIQAMDIKTFNLTFKV